jgi:hypothetical protein
MDGKRILLKNLKPESDQGKEAISAQVTVNRQRIAEIFDNCHDFIILDWRYGPGLEYVAFSVYSDTLIPEKKVELYESIPSGSSHPRSRSGL